MEPRPKYWGWGAYDSIKRLGETSRILGTQENESWDLHVHVYIMVKTWSCAFTHGCNICTHFLNLSSASFTSYWHLVSGLTLNHKTQKSCTIIHKRALIYLMTVVSRILGLAANRSPQEHIMLRPNIIDGFVSQIYLRPIS